MASKYAGLGAHLRGQRGRTVPMSFADIERVTGHPLPPSARRHRPWWSNNPQNSVATKVWLEAGFRTEAVDLDAERLVFRRAVEEREAENTSHKPGERVLARHPALGALRGTVKIMPGTDLTSPADPDWGKVYD